MTTSRQNPSVERGSAEHESGHVLGIWVPQKQCGLRRPRFSRVLVRTLDEIRSGPFLLEGEAIHCAGLILSPSRGLARPVGDDDAVYRWARDMLLEGIFTCAGPAAEARFLHRSFERVLTSEGGRGDFEFAVRLAVHFQRCGGDQSLFFTVCVTAAQRLMQQPCVRTAISALADVLQVRRSLTATEAIRIIDPLLIGPIPPIVDDAMAQLAGLRPVRYPLRDRRRDHREAGAGGFVLASR